MHLAVELALRLDGHRVRADDDAFVALGDAAGHEVGDGLHRVAAHRALVRVGLGRHAQPRAERARHVGEHARGRAGDADAADGVDDVLRRDAGVLERLPRHLLHVVDGARREGVRLHLHARRHARHADEDRRAVELLLLLRSQRRQRPIAAAAAAHVARELAQAPRRHRPVLPLTVLAGRAARGLLSLAITASTQCYHTSQLLGSKSGSSAIVRKAWPKRID